ncbi:hypothetical protein KJ662_03050 [Patescibacteria group bacterium]|nr:hypothetical protein [Patescibacteria group bacterium]MBU1685208.1 hypothetical protein [Patescibacteria group bacterium]MBU1938872.1 hypothetical protein [Patescibacteria group bacterium]
MGGPENKEGAKQPENIHDQLQSLHAQGILLSDRVEEQLKAEEYPSGTLNMLKDMAKDLNDLEKIRLDKVVKIVTREVDINLVEENLRRINNKSEIESKFHDLRSMCWKYRLLQMGKRYDLLTSISRPLSPSRVTFRPDETEKVHNMPLGEASQWAEKHMDRVEILGKLVDARIIPADQYEKYRKMEPDQALMELKKIQEKHEKKEHASAEDVLGQDLNRIA